MFCTLMGPKLADFPSFGQYGAEISRRKIEDINLVPTLKLKFTTGCLRGYHLLNKKDCKIMSPSHS